MLAFNAYSFVRQPAYYILGEEEFKGVQVYDVIQDNDWNYWFSTNEGLIFYDHYSYQKISCPESKSISFFNFVQSETGAIYCNNLNNQVFIIRDGKCELFYEINPAESQSDIRLFVTPENNLMIGGRTIILLDEDGNVSSKLTTTHGYTGFPFLTKDNKIILSVTNSDSVIVVNDNELKYSVLTYDDPTRSVPGIIQFFRIGEACFALHMQDKKIYSFNESTFELSFLGLNPSLTRSESVRLYETTNRLWVAGTLPGVVLFNENPSQNSTGIFYQDIFISDVYEDCEGNILLCTFDNGIYVITDLNTPDAYSEFKDDPVTAIKSDSTLGLIFGTTKGRVVKYKDEKFETIRNIGKRPIEVILIDHNFPWLIFDDGNIRAYNKKNGKIIDIFYASLKDGFILNENEFYLATNIGFLKGTLSNAEQLTLTWIDELKFRNFAVEHETISNQIYVSTVNGLFVSDSSQSFKEIRFNDESIFASTLHSAYGLVYAPLANSGILIIENGIVVDKIYLKVNDQIVSVFKMIVHDWTIFAHTNLGLCQFDLSGKLIRSFNQSAGQTNHRIIDFEFVDNQLWMSKPNGLQTIDLAYLGEPAPAPQIKIMHVFANDVEIFSDSTNEFNSETRKFQFVLSSPTLRYKSEIRYHHKLVGYDEDWIINDYNSNIILYNALAPGDYEFLVKAENQNEFSDTISYKFYIAYPFYATWWFLSLLVLSFLVIVFLFYRWQLNRQRTKARQINELNASKLTAIQSQMNPHFIFNSLNSIQDLILKGDVEHSYSYITTFSNLVRRTLSYSDKDFIDFEQELKLLELYLSLEKLRFKKDFSFTIDINDISDIQIPPMLIQPFIENALVHGLLHKEGDKKLSITFSINKHLICVVEDNGIGREEAKAIKTRQRSEHESFSVQAIRKRFEILSEHFKGELGYHYTDLTENGKACGTRVTLQIPIKHKF